MPAALPGERVGLLTASERWVEIWDFDVDAWADIACRAAGRNMTRAEWDQFGPRDRRTGPPAHSGLRRLTQTDQPAGHAVVMARWSEFEREEPAFAARVRALFDTRKHKTIATLRADGSPRISGIEVEFDGGDLSFGSMPEREREPIWSATRVRTAQPVG